MAIYCGESDERWQQDCAVLLAGPGAAPSSPATLPAPRSNSSPALLRKLSVGNEDTV